MTTVQQSTRISAPIERVFEAITDPRRGPDWNNNIVEVTGVSPLPVGVGTSWHQVVVMAGRPMRLQCRVAEMRPPYGGVVEVSGDQQGRLWTECRAVPGGTEVTQGMDFTPPGGALGRIGATIGRGLIERELRRTLERQRAVLEAEAGR